jgi:hypothetical protein
VTVYEAIDRLNTLAEEAAKDNRPMHTMEEVKAFLKNPPRRPRSVPMDEAMAFIVGTFRIADEEARRDIASKLSSRARRRFLGYAMNLAVVAVREDTPDLIEQGLVALAIENGGQDWRDSIVALFQLYHSASKLGMDVEATFAKVALLAEPGVIKKEMNGFPQRPPESRSLKAFCMAEEIGEDGFRYRQIPWNVK